LNKFLLFDVHNSFYFL